MASLYQDTYWFPSGALAAAVQARVFPRHSNSLATIWQDAAETIPQSNPISTSVGGVLSFYATPGDYWVYIGGETFSVSIDSDGVVPDVWHEVFRFEQAVPSTTWMINHSMDSNPDVQVIIGGQHAPADIMYTDLNNITINFSTPQSGLAILRR